MPVIDNIYVKIMDCIRRLRRRQFNTKDVIDVFSQQYRQDWNTLLERYGRGGRGCGRNYSAHNYIALRLVTMSRRGNIKQGDFERAPEERGNPSIAKWEI
jgi:hypothetical protein